MTKYELRITGECKQNLKICKKRGLPMQELWDVVAKLQRSRGQVSDCFQKRSKTCPHDRPPTYFSAR